MRRRAAALPAAVTILAATGAVGACGGPPAVPEAHFMPIPMSDVIPAPLEARPAPGADFHIEPSTVIAAARSAEVRPTADWLAALLRRGTGFPLPVVAPGSRGSGVISLQLGDAGAALGGEGYTLSVSPSEVRIRANAGAGLFHGAQTLRQLLPAAIETTHAAGPWVVEGGTIVDHPRYPWRAAMLDVARHFFSVADVERYVDELALYKVNVLELHLSDDQGWRIAITSWPRLTTVGGSTAVGGGPGGYFTQAQYREIVAYAASRYITIVPEIDMPGHVNAALASYGELSCDGVAPPLYTGIDVGFSSLCVGRPITMRFVDAVIAELAALTPGPYLSIGGDEAQSTPPSEYASFIAEAAGAVSSHGKVPVGWAEIAAARLPPDAVAVYWNIDDAGSSARQAAERGLRVVLAPANHCYLDQKYDPSTVLGLTWAGPISVEQSYDWEPTDYAIPAGRIEGVEAPLWSETLTTMSDIEQMAFPRLPGIAEIGWSPPSTHDWARYRVRLAAQAPRWEAMGIDFDRASGVPWPQT